MTHRNPGFICGNAFAGTLLLAAGFVSLMLVNPAVSAFVTSSPAANGAPLRSVR